MLSQSKKAFGGKTEFKTGGKGLGKLLTAVGLQILIAEGVKELEVVDVSDQYESTIKRLGFQNTSVYTTETLRLDQLPKNVLGDYAKEFLK